MRKVNKAITIIAILSMSMAIAAGCGKKETEESFEFQPASTEAETTEAETEAEVDPNAEYAVVQENLDVAVAPYDPTVLYEGYPSYADGELHTVEWFKASDTKGVKSEYRSYSYPEAGIESISIGKLPDVVEFKDAEKLDYTLRDVASKMHVTAADFCEDAPYETYDISDAEEAGVFIYNCYDFLRSWRVSTETYKIDPEHIDLKSIVSAYTVLDYEKELDAPLDEGGMAPIEVDPTKVWVKKEEDGTTDYFFLIQTVSYFAVNDATKAYSDDETIEDNSQLKREIYPGMMCVRVNLDYDWVHCIMHLGYPRNDGNGTNFYFDNSNYVLRSSAKFTPFREIKEGPIWHGTTVEPQYIKEFVY